MNNFNFDKLKEQLEVFALCVIFVTTVMAITPSI